MNILVIADEETPSLWDYFRPEKLKDVDLILSCGDLNPKYLSFLATFCKGPVLYVHGNHDDRYEKTSRCSITSQKGHLTATSSRPLRTNSDLSRKL